MLCASVSLASVTSPPAAPPETPPTNQVSQPTQAEDAPQPSSRPSSGNDGEFATSLRFSSDLAASQSTLDVWQTQSQVIRLPKFLPTVPRFGAQGTAVQLVQQQLQAHGYQPGPIDGIFGAQTEAAVRQFQQVHNLPIDGNVRDDTWQLLRQLGSAQVEPIQVQVATPQPSVQAALPKFAPAPLAPQFHSIDRPSGDQSSGGVPAWAWAAIAGLAASGGAAYSLQQRSEEETAVRPAPLSHEIHHPEPVYPPQRSLETAQPLSAEDASALPLATAVTQEEEEIPVVPLTEEPLASISELATEQLPEQPLEPILESATELSDEIPVSPSSEPSVAVAAAVNPTTSIPEVDGQDLSQLWSAATVQPAGHLEGFLFDLFDPDERQALISHQGRVHAGESRLRQQRVERPMLVSKVSKFVARSRATGSLYRYSLADDLGGSFIIVGCELWVTQIAYQLLVTDQLYILTVRRATLDGEVAERQCAVTLDELKPDTRERVATSQAA